MLRARHASLLAAGVAVLAASLLPAGADAAPDRARASAVIEEIVVTSRRRAESAQDIPVAVTAFRPEDVERIQPRTLRDFDGLAPNLFIGMNTAGPSAGAIFIRGLGYADIEKTQSPAVAVILDGIYQGTSTGQLIDAFDIEQLEINRGPQGVLFGKNTTGGTIVVKRTRPTGEWGLRSSVQLGNYDERNFKLIANAPLIEDQLGLKLGGTYKARDGFYDNLTRGGDAGAVDYWSGTASLLWTPFERFEAQFTYDRIEDTGDIPPQDPRYNGDDPFDNEADLDESQLLNYDSFGLQMEWQSPVGTVSSITGYVTFNDTVAQDFDGSTPDTSARPLVQLHTFRDQSYNQLTQELRLAGQVTDRINYTVGGFYLFSEQNHFQFTNQIVQIDNPVEPLGLTCPDIGLAPNPNPALATQFCQIGPLLSSQFANHDVESIGLFANGNWFVTNELELSLGARWIDEEKEFDNQFFDLTTGAAIAGAPVDDKDSWDDVILKATANWQVTPDNLVYASYAEGFRSGGFSIRATGTSTCPECDPADPIVIGTGAGGVPVISAPTTFDPEEVWTVEIGTKNDLFDNRLRINAAAFYTELDGAQFSSILTTPGIIPGTNTLINNADESEIKGVELEVTGVVTEGLTVRAAGGLQDAERKAFTIDGTLVPVASDGSGQAGAPGPFFAEAQQIGRSPDWNWSVSTIYERQVGPGTVSVNATARGQDEFVIVNSLVGFPVFEDGYTLFDASASYQWTSERGTTYQVSMFGKNLGDKEYLQQALPLGQFGGFQGWGPPLTFAVELQVQL